MNQFNFKYASTNNISIMNNIIQYLHHMHHNMSYFIYILINIRVMSVNLLQCVNYIGTIIIITLQQK